MTKHTRNQLRKIAVKHLKGSIYDELSFKGKEMMVESYVDVMQKIIKHRIKLNKKRGFCLETLPSHLPSEFNYDYSGKTSNCGYYGSAKYKFMKPTVNQVYVKFLKELNSRKEPISREDLVIKVQPRSKLFNPKVYDCNIFSGLREAGLIEYTNKKIVISELGRSFLKHFGLV